MKLFWSLPLFKRSGDALNFSPTFYSAGFQKILKGRNKKEAVKNVYGVEIEPEVKAAKPTEKNVKLAEKPAKTAEKESKTAKRKENAADVNAEPAKKKTVPAEKKAKPIAKKPKTTAKKSKPAAGAAKAAEKPALAEIKPPMKKATVIIQSPMGGEISPEQILAKIDAADKVYVRVDANKAYWVNGEHSGDVHLW